MFSVCCSGPFDNFCSIRKTTTHLLDVDYYSSIMNNCYDLGVDNSYEMVVFPGSSFHHCCCFFQLLIAVCNSWEENWVALFTLSCDFFNFLGEPRSLSCLLPPLWSAVHQAWSITSWQIYNVSSNVPYFVWLVVIGSSICMQHIRFLWKWFLSQYSTS
jgi:hypothetical protein